MKQFTDRNKVKEVRLYESKKAGQSFYEGQRDESRHIAIYFIS
jgi:hypothetical protein